MRNLNSKHKRLISFIKEIYGDNLANKRVIDVGGNDGLILANLPDCLMKINFDIDIACLRDAPVDSVLGDIQRLPFRNGSFDICIFSEVIEHVQDPQGVASEIARISSEVILTTPNNSLLRRIVVLPGLVIRRGLSLFLPQFARYRNINIAAIMSGSDTENKGYMTHVREYSWKQVKEFFEREGFRLIRFKAIGSFLSKPDILAKLRLERISPKLAGKMLMHFQRI